MAGRVNTKFVILLSAIIALLVLSAVGLYVGFVYKSAAQLEQAGDQLMSEGETYLAVEKYGNALNKNRTDIDLIDKYLAGIAALEARDIVDARTYLGQMRQWKRTITELDPGNVDRQLDYYQYLSMLARDLDGGFYSVIADRTDNRLTSNPDDLLARRYRGIARTRMMNSDTSIEDRQTALADLQAYFAEHPEDDEVAHMIATWNLNEADRLDRPGGRPDEAATLREQAQTLSTQALEADPDDPQRLLDHLRILLNPNVLPNDPSRAQELSNQQRELAQPYLDRLEGALLTNPSPQHVVLGAADMLSRGDVEVTDEPGVRATRGVQRAQALLEAAVTAEPDNFTYRMVLGELLRRQGKTERALEIYQSVRNMDITGDSLRVIRGTSIINSASLSTGNLLIAQAANASPDQKKQIEAEVQQILNELATQEGDTPRTMQLKGKLALTRGDTLEAAIHLDEAANRLATGNDIDSYLETLLLAGRAHQASGNGGAAIERFERVLEVRPTLPQVQLELARLHIQFRQFGQARELVDAILATNPDDESAQRLQASLIAQNPASGERAIETFEKIYANGDTSAVRPLAQLYLVQNRRSDATALLERHLKENPQDVQSLAMLLPLLEDDEAKVQWVDTAEQAGANERTIGLLRRSLDPEQANLNIDELIEQLLGDEEDPFLRALGEARLYARVNDDEKTREALDRAAAINPDHAEIIELQFNAALQDEDMSAAETLANRARTLNTDLAQGEFYRGRLASSKEDWATAIAAYRRGLTLRKVYSDGWYRLGTVLLADSKPDEATEAFKTAVEQRPNNVPALRNLAQLMLTRQQPDEALKLLRQAREYQPRNNELLEQYLAIEQQVGDKRRVIEIRQQIAANNPGNINNRRVLAYILAADGQADEAQITINAVVEQEGLTRQNVQTLAAIDSELDDSEAGLTRINDYLAELGDAIETDDLLMLARFQRVIGDMSGAFTTYRKAIAIDQSPKKIVMRELADIQFALGLNEESARLYEQLYALDNDDKKVALRYAENLLRLDRAEEAKEILLQHPDDVQALILKALIAQTDEDRTEAVRLLNRAIARDRNNATLYLQRARLFIRDPDQVNAAEQDLLEALRLNPNQTDARALLADLYLSRNETNEGIRELRTLLNRTPDFQPARLKLLNVYRTNGRAAEARSLLNESVERYPDSQQWAQLAAQQALTDGDLQAAAKHAQRVYEINPTSRALFFTAVTLISAEQPDAALTLLGENPDLLNNEPLLQAVRGRAMSATGDGDGASQVFQKALARATSYGMATNIASQMRQVIPTEEAVELIASITEAQDLTALRLVAVNLNLQARRFDEALDQLAGLESRISVGDDATTSRYQQMMAMALYGTGRYADSRTYYQKLLDENPDDIGTLNNFAYLLANDMDDAAAALPLAERAAMLSGDNPQVLDTLGWIRFKLGQTTEARNDLERSVSLRPLAPTCLHLGEVYEYLGLPTRAAQMYRQAIDLAGQSGEDDIKKQAEQRLEQLNAQS